MRRTIAALFWLGVVVVPAAAKPPDGVDQRNPVAARTRVAMVPPAPEPIRSSRFAEDVCKIIETEAKRRGLPETFFARLIWRESMFDPDAVSPKGAEGIAQFMPYTARLRGLDDSFAPHKALPASASFLADLRRDLGNLGLAAAGYNAGAEAVRGWLAQRQSLPYETQDYVQFVTGRPAEDWVKPGSDHAIPGIGNDPLFLKNCIKLVKRQTALPATATAAVERAPRKPWGVVISGSFSESRALLTFRAIKERFPSLLSGKKPMVVRKRSAMGRRKLVSVIVGTDSRGEADGLCGRLQSLGGACMVLKND
jgi:hypothetical protein